MRIQNSLRNMIFGFTGQMVSSIMGFVVRSVFIYTLDIEYLGIEGLFSSILIIFSLANLGFDTAMTYSLYKPLADNDQYKIQALMNLYRKAYRIIGLIVFTVGISLLPFLPYLMNGETSVTHIHVIYLFFLLNSVSSYYFAYKQCVISADQKNHVISKIHSIFTILSNSSQIILLWTTKNYILVLAIQIAFRIMENIYASKKADKIYPFLKSDNKATLSAEDKKSFLENLYAQTLYKVSAVVITGTDNIVISVFVGLTWVGIYSNYLLILGTLSTFISYLFYSIVASVGNLVIKEDTEKKYFIFRVLHFANFWIFGFCTICLWTLINPFITMWVGSAYVFSKFIVFSILLNFFTGGMQNAATTFRETTGLFKKGKYRPVFAAIINLVVSVILAKQIGVAGVLLGTVVSRLCTYFWYDPYVIYKYVFHQPVRSYFIRYFLLGSLILISAVVTDQIASVFFTDPLLNLVSRGMICLILPNTLFFVLFRRSEEFQYLWNIVTRLTNKMPFKRPLKKSYTS